MTFTVQAGEHESEAHFVVNHLFGIDRVLGCDSAGPCRLLSESSADDKPYLKRHISYNATAAALGLLEVKAVVSAHARCLL